MPCSRSLGHVTALTKAWVGPAPLAVGQRLPSNSVGGRILFASVQSGSPGGSNAGFLVRSDIFSVPPFLEPGCPFSR